MFFYAPGAKVSGGAPGCYRVCQSPQHRQWTTANSSNHGMSESNKCQVRPLPLLLAHIATHRLPIP